MARGRHKRGNQAKHPEAGQVLGPPLSEKAKLGVMMSETEHGKEESQEQMSMEELQAEVLRLQVALDDANAKAARAEALKVAAGGLDRPVMGGKQAKKNTRTVAFGRAWKKYYPGDRAGFAPKIAKALVEAGVARYADPLIQRAAEEG